MMKFGRFEVKALNHGFYRLDGGAMFGTVPRVIWSRLIPPDEENRIRLATRSLLIDTGDRRILVELGLGDKWTEKLRKIYGVESFTPEQAGFDPGAVTDIVISHLHFDHVGQISRFKPGGDAEVELSFPQARVHLQADNFETARRPNVRERASYLKDNVEVLERARLDLVRGSRELEPGIWVHQTNGHTRGQQWLEVRSGSETIAFPADMIPTSRHLPLPYLMGYDMSAETLLREKEDFLRRAVAGQWIVVFVHDPDTPAGRVKVDERGHFALAERVDF
jgi:glyoxylase-like metal-dependent hydrolase (beta-lactamase superfamily II)